MTPYRARRVLLADQNTGRSRAIELTLKRIWKARVCKVATREQAFEASKQAERDGAPFDVVMVAFGFGGFDHLAIFEELCNKRAGTSGVLIIDHPERPVPSRVKVGHHLVAKHNVGPGDSDLVKQLRVIMGREPTVPPAMSNAGRLSSALKFQVRSLDPNGQFDKGKEILCELVSQVMPEIRRFQLHSIAQGFSGARVFRVSYADLNSRNRRQFVLKLTYRHKHHSWKCENELKYAREIQDRLGEPPLPMIPEIHGLEAGGGGEPLPAETDEWLAVMYTFLGGERVFIRDFEQVYLDPERCLRELQESRPHARLKVSAADLPRFFLEKLFESLEGWYRQSRRVRPKPLWSAEEPQEGRPLGFPPYRFGWRRKSEIIESIHSLRQYGVSLAPAGWKRRCDLALNCLPTGRKMPKSLRRLAELHPVLLTPVHGDLIANNVLMALDREAPFLIDFACYQSEGHPAQDFARLEFSVKFQLMGRERRNVPPGKDLNSNQFAKWCDAEDWLADWSNDTSRFPDLGLDTDSVKRAYMLGRYVREEARNVHRSLLTSSDLNSAPDFELSYDTALLYHTLRAIGYPALSPLKRMLAVYSAGGLVQRLPTAGS